MQLSREQNITRSDAAPVVRSDHFTLTQAAQYIGISPRTLQRWVQQGVIEVVKIGRIIKFSRAALDQFLRQHTIAAAAAAADKAAAAPARATARKKR